MNRSIIPAFCFLLVLTYAFSEEIVTRKDGTGVVLYDDHSRAEFKGPPLSASEIVSKNKGFLRKGISASDQEIATACEMYEQGWRYTMPRPKSRKAAWGVFDRRTTWFYGWWFNVKTKKYSAATPRRSAGGLFLGDNQNNARSWRNGGSPGRPDVFMFLLSKRGGGR